MIIPGQILIFVIRMLLFWLQLKSFGVVVDIVSEPLALTDNVMVATVFLQGLLDVTVQPTADINEG